VRSPLLDISLYSFYVIVGSGDIFLFIARVALIVERIAEVAKA
jgi:hypothetical protein